MVRLLSMLDSDGGESRTRRKLSLMARSTPMHREIYERLQRNPPRIDHSGVELDIERDQIETIYAPLAEDFLEQTERSGRLIVAVAGAPGSGKSAFGSILVATINAIAGKETAVLVGLDGWHFCNDYLESHHIERDGQEVALRSIKGAAESFDAEAVSACLLRMRSQPEVSYPIYSRELHDPMPNAGKVLSSHRIVIVEGNYLLLDEPGWGRLRDLFDVRIFISAPEDVRVPALRQRHGRSGRSAEYTERQIATVDLPNARRIAPGAAFADIVAHKSDVRRIDRLERSL